MVVVNWRDHQEDGLGIHVVKGRTIRKVMGGGGEFSSRRNFFSSSNSLYEFFLGYSVNIFLGLIGVQEFFFI